MDTDAYILLVTHKFNSNLSFRIVSDAVEENYGNHGRQPPQSRALA